VGGLLGALLGVVIGGSIGGSISSASHADTSRRSVTTRDAEQGAVDIAAGSASVAVDMCGAFFGMLLCAGIGGIIGGIGGSVAGASLAAKASSSLTEEPPYSSLTPRMPIHRPRRAL
jgi:hypothetical protein